jgi:hypothetical protein
MHDVGQGPRSFIRSPNPRIWRNALMPERVDNIPSLTPIWLGSVWQRMTSKGIQELQDIPIPQPSNHLPVVGSAKESRFPEYMMNRAEEEPEPT